jgi:hypothetical protein
MGSQLGSVERREELLFDLFKATAFGACFKAALTGCHGQDARLHAFCKAICTTRDYDSESDREDMDTPRFVRWMRDVYLPSSESRLAASFAGRNRSRLDADGTVLPAYRPGGKKCGAKRLARRRAKDLRTDRGIYTKASRGPLFGASDA